MALGRKIEAGQIGMPKEQADYRAAKRSTRLRPRPKGIPSEGASADYHLRSDSDHLWVGELGMEMDRNNVIGERILDYQEKNVLQDGFDYDPQTGDVKLDADLKAWWKDHSEDPSKIDAQGQFNFNRLTRFVYRGYKAAGDIWPILRFDGSIELAEFYRVRSPSRSTKGSNIVLGVEMNEFRRREQAWFTKDVIPATSRATINKSQLKPIKFYHPDDPLEDEAPRCLQVFDPDRCTQTRGLSAFKAVFDYLGMHEDLQFLMLMKSQMANMVLLLRQRHAEMLSDWVAGLPRDGAAAPNIQALTEDLLAQEMRPGMQVGSLPGETLELASPNIPNSEFFAHMKMVAALCGLPFAVALVAMLLDAGETNFSGFRGAQNEARLVQRCEQTDLEQQWHRPILWFCLDRLANEDPAMAKARDGKYGRGKVNLYSHRWKKPRWPYIEPVNDATAALIRRGNTLTSPRRQCADDGVGDWDEIYVETIDDHFAGLDYAYKRAAELIARHQLDVEIDVLAQRLLPLPNPERTQVSIASSAVEPPEPAAPAKPPSGGKNAGK